MKKTKLVCSLLLVCVFWSLLLTGCGKTAPTVDLNGYVKVTLSGYDGCGSVSAFLDVDRILADHGDRLTKKLDSQFFEEKTPELAAQFVFSAHKPYVLTYDSRDDLKNGDELTFRWNTSENGIEMLKKVLDVRFTCSEFTYTVQDLAPLREVDPFADVQASYRGISGTADAWVGDFSGTVRLEDGTKLTIPLVNGKGGTSYYNCKNGDRLPLKVDERSVDRDSLAREHGITLSALYGEYVVDGLAFYPYEEPSLAFAGLPANGQSMRNAWKAASKYVAVDNENRSVEFVGALFYYQNPGNTLKRQWNANNQLVLIYHITNGKVPGGWYTYLAPNNDVVVGYDDPGDGTKNVTTMLNTGKPLLDDATYYAREYYISYSKYIHSIVFEHEGVLYVGHRTIEDCIAAYESNEFQDIEFFTNEITVKRQYDHLCASDSLKEYVQER